MWKDPGRKFQTQGRNHQQSEAYQATLTRNLSSMISPSTISDSASPLLYRFDSAPASALSDPYPSYLSLSDLFLCSYFCCVCVSLFMCLLTSISHSHVLPYINKILALTCLAIYKQNKYNWPVWYLGFKN